MSTNNHDMMDDMSRFAYQMPSNFRASELEALAAKLDMEHAQKAAAAHNRQVAILRQISRIEGQITGLGLFVSDLKALLAETP
jgi:hypothetical protein